LVEKVEIFEETVWVKPTKSKKVKTAKTTTSAKKADKPAELREDSNTDYDALIAEGTVEDFEHTQSGENLKVLKLSTQLSKDEFKSFNNFMKSSGKGYYSRYAKGFILNDVEQDVEDEVIPDIESQVKSFIEYVYAFYGPGSIYSDIFDHSLTKDEIRSATESHMKNSEDVCFDSHDREMVRDIMLLKRENIAAATTTVKQADSLLDFACEDTQTVQTVEEDTQSESDPKSSQVMEFIGKGLELIIAQVPKEQREDRSIIKSVVDEMIKEVVAEVYGYEDYVDHFETYLFNDELKKVCVDQVILAA
jgi:hypothetical protein